MPLGEAAVQKFKKIYEIRFGKELSDEEARQYARRFFRLIEITYQPMKREELATVAARRKSLGVMQNRNNSKNG
jgi:hypothetical protein